MNYEQEKAVLELGDAIIGVMEAFNVDDSMYLKARKAAIEALGLKENGEEVTA